MKKALFCLLMALMLIPCVSMAQKTAKDGDIVVGDIVFMDTTTCDVFLWELNGGIYFESGIFVFQLHDTTYVLNLKIGYSTDETDEVTASCDYNWQGHYFTTDTVITERLTSIYGCDSVVTLDLTLNKKYRDTLSITTCQPYTFRGETYTVEDYYSDTVRNEELACDSIFTLDLTVADTMIKPLPSVEACSRYTWDLNDSIYTETTLDYTVIDAADAAQCDTLYVMLIFIGEPTEDTTTVTACRSFEWDRTDSTYTESTFTSFIYKAESDDMCDTNFRLDLTVIDTMKVVTFDSVCGNYTWAVNDSLYTESAYDTVYSVDPTLASCDTMFTLELKIYEKFDTIIAKVCDSYIITRHFSNDSTALDTIIETGNYFDSEVATNGCVTNRIYDLDITPSRRSLDTIDTVRCTNLSLQFLRAHRDTLIVFDAAHPNGQLKRADERVAFTRNSVARAHYSINDAPQCMDSIVVYNITINKTSVLSLPENIINQCGEYKWNTIRNRVVDTTHWGGLDSISIVETINEGIVEVNTGEATIKVFVTTDESYADVAASTVDADTIIILPTTAAYLPTTDAEHSTDTTVVTVNEREVSFVEGETTTNILFTTDTTAVSEYTKIIPFTVDTNLNRVGGIDTTVIVFDSVHRLFTKSGRDSVEIGVNEHGCALYNLVVVTIHPKPVISISGDFKVSDKNDVATIYAVFDSADRKTKYEWTIAGSGKIVENKKDTISITGVTANSDVQLKVTDKNNCVVESWITILYGVGISETDNLNLAIYPNPTAQIVNLTTDYEMSQIAIYNMVGVQVMSKQVAGTQQSIDLSALPKGAYTLRVNMANGKTATRRLIKSK